MAWTKEWTIENVEQNFKALGWVESDDIKQLIADSKELRRISRDGLFFCTKGEKERLEEMKRQVRENRR